VVASRPGGGPQRTCVGCRAVRAQGRLVRIALDACGGLAVNPRRVTGRSAYLCPSPNPRRVTGRSAYLCPSPTCLEQALRRSALPRALRVQVPRLDVAMLRRLVRCAAADVCDTPVESSEVSH